MKYVFHIDTPSTDLAADPKSAIGSAYAFMRPKRQAQDISNTSMVLQFASQRFVNNFLNGSVR